MKLLAARTAPHSGGLAGETLAIALAGSLLMWAAQPPLALRALAWVAPIPWLALIRADRIPGRRPYIALWFAGVIYWLATIQWLRLPHPAVYLGWFVLSAYLGCYLSVFIAIARVAVHRLRVPLCVAAPVVWTGLELARAHLFTGFLMASLAHTQVRSTTLIQISDLVGEYGVDFLIMTVAAAIASVIIPPRRYAALVPAAVLVACTLLYGHRALNVAINPQSEIRNPKTVRIALIQGNTLADWSYGEAKQRATMDEYIGLSNQALTLAKQKGDGRSIDLVVWPETTFRSGLREVDSNFRVPPDWGRTREEIETTGPSYLAALTEQLGAPILVGTDRIHLIDDPAAPIDEPSYQAWNSSVLVDRSGKIMGTYDKSHLVMFGEYIPFAHWLPFVYQYLPISGGTEFGIGPKALCTDDICYAPNICYETVIPHVIRDEVVTLSAAGHKPDVLVNITNDSWYWGSSELDMHLACDVFRAIEARTPLVIAANGGISASIDAAGRIIAQSPRQKPDVIIADVELRDRNSPYMKHGDWFAAACLTITIAFAFAGRLRRSSNVSVPAR
jgi:apolipoprotein N-acyltransferase